MWHGFCSLEFSFSLWEEEAEMIQSASSDQDPATKADLNHAMGLVWEKFEQVDRHFEQVDRHFEQVDRHFEQVEGRLETLAEEVRENRVYSGILHEDMMYQFKLVLECLDPTRARLEDHEGRIQRLEREFPTLKDAVSTRR